jgi:hypothetical protein
MAYTFDEAFEGTRDEQHLVRATLVITQSDGRTAVSYMSQVGPGLLHPAPGGGRALSNMSQFPAYADAMSVRFNDRSANDGSQLGWIPFTGSADRVGLTITDQGGNQYSAEFRLLSWGAISYSVQMSQPNQAKLLMGWGETIGFGEPQALYVISFNELVSWIK